jgi:Uncharacterized conserved protein
VDVGAWVTVVNQSGAAFTDARLKLMAGDVQRVQPQRVYPAAVAMEAKAARSDGFQEKAFFEYHLYTLGRATTLADNSTKQVELFPTAAGVGCEKTLVYNGQAGLRSYGTPLTDRDYGVAGNRKIDVFLA